MYNSSIYKRCVATQWNFQESSGGAGSFGFDGLIESSFGKSFRSLQQDLVREIPHAVTTGALGDPILNPTTSIFASDACRRDR
jgi:hypothetical protein